MNVLDKGARLFKLLLTLLRETDNHIGRQRRISIYLTQKIAFVFVFFCGIFPVHPLQCSIASALQRKMEMRAHLRHCGDRLCKLFGDDARLQGSETDSSDAVHCINSTDEVEQRLFFALREIESVGGKVDTGQHDFLVSGLHQTFYFFYHITLAAASDSAARVRDNTISTELIASILYFQECAGVLRRFADRECLVLTVVCHIHEEALTLRVGWFSTVLTFCQKVFQNIHKIFLLIISDDQINRRILFEFFPSRLHITAAGHDNRIGIHLFRFVQHLPRFPVRNVRHGTRIDNVNIRSRCKRHDLVPSVFEELLDGFQLICVHFTPKIMQSYRFFHAILLSSSSLLLKITKIPLYLCMFSH